MGRPTKSIPRSQVAAAKPGHVSRHAAAKGGNQVGTGQAVGGQLFIECGDGGQPFRLFPGGEDEPGHAISRGGVAFSHGVGIQGRDVGIRDQEHPNPAIYPAAALPGLLEKAGADDDIVGAGGGGMEGAHKGAFFLLKLFPESFLDQAAAPYDGGNFVPIARSDGSPAVSSLAIRPSSSSIRGTWLSANSSLHRISSTAATRETSR